MRVAKRALAIALVANQLTFLSGTSFADVITECGGMLKAKSACLAEKSEEIAKTMERPAELSKSAERARIAKAQSAIKGILNDPSSAQFKDIIYIASTGAVCGQFNGKNALGGYVPFQPFAYSATDVLIPVQGAPSTTDSLENVKRQTEQMVTYATVNALCGGESLAHGK